MILIPYCLKKLDPRQLAKVERFIDFIKSNISESKYLETFENCNCAGQSFLTFKLCGDASITVEAFGHIWSIDSIDGGKNLSNKNIIGEIEK